MLVIGEKEGGYMKRKIEYTDGPIGNVKRVKDFLPPPEELVLKEKNIRVTINLRKSSVDFFKNVARSSKSKYQKVIRLVLDQYATHFSKA